MTPVQSQLLSILNLWRLSWSRSGRQSLLGHFIFLHCPFCCLFYLSAHILDTRVQLLISDLDTLTFVRFLTRRCRPAVRAVEFSFTLSINFHSTRKCK